MKKSVLFFDLGEVLVANRTNPIARIQQILLAHGHAKKRVDETLEIAQKNWESLPAASGWISTWEQEKKVMSGYYTEVAQSSEIDSSTLADELFWLCHYPHHAELYPDVLTILPELKTNYRLAVISNALPSTNWVLDRLNIRRYFECVILSAHVGCAKPDKRIYQIALDAMQTHPEAAIFVDDQIKNVETARKLGMRGFHLVRDEDSGEIHTLAELAGALIND